MMYRRRAWNKVIGDTGGGRPNRRVVATVGLILRSDADRKNAKVRIGSSRSRVVVLDPTIIVEPPEPQQVTFGKHDDLVCALGLACYVSLQVYNDHGGPLV